MNKHLKIIRNAFFGSILLGLVIALMNYVTNEPIDPSRLWLWAVLFLLGILNGYAETTYRKNHLSYAIGSGIFILLMILLLQWMRQGKIDLVTIPVFLLVGIPLTYWMNKDKPVR